MNENVKEKKPKRIPKIFKNFQVLKHPFALFFYVLIILYIITLIVPCAWMIISTFKDRLEFKTNRFGWPEYFTWENYKYVFSYLNVPVTLEAGGMDVVEMPRLMLNAILYAGLVNAASLCMQTLVAYGCAKYKSKVGSILYVFAIITMILPLVGTMAGRLSLYRSLGIYNKFLGTVFAFAGWGGSNFLLLYATFKGVSNEYRDAAFIDGAGHARVMFTIMIPMVKTTYLALFILGFISSWNDYSTPMVYLRSFPTIAYGLFRFTHLSDSKTSAIPMQITGCVVVMIPLIILFLIFRNKIMGNLAIGGLKG